MKKFLKYLGFGALSVVTFFIAIAIITSVGSIDKEETFPPYIAEAVPKLTTWDIEQYKLLMSEQGMGAVTLDQWQLFLNLFSKLGQLEAVSEPALQNWKAASTINTGNTTYAVYLVPLTFDTGPAHVELGLQHNSDKVEINSVRFLADRLLEQSM